MTLCRFAAKLAAQTLGRSWPATEPTVFSRRLKGVLRAFVTLSLEQWASPDRSRHMPTCQETNRRNLALGKSALDWRQNDPECV
jgi:hypothetical protein